MLSLISSLAICSRSRCSSASCTPASPPTPSNSLPEGAAAARTTPRARPGAPHPAKGPRQLAHAADLEHAKRWDASRAERGRRAGMVPVDPGVGNRPICTSRPLPGRWQHGFTGIKCALTYMLRVDAVPRAPRRGLRALTARRVRAAVGLVPLLAQTPADSERLHPGPDRHLVSPHAATAAAAAAALT